MDQGKSRKGTLWNVAPGDGQWERPSESEICLEFLSSRLLRLLPDLGRQSYLRPIRVTTLSQFRIWDAMGSEFEPSHVLAGVHLVKSMHLST